MYPKFSLRLSLTTIFTLPLAYGKCALTGFPHMLQYTQNTPPATTSSSTVSQHVNQSNFRTTLDASNIRLDVSFAQAVPIKIEAQNPPELSVLALPVKSEPKPSGGKEIIQLLDSETEDGDSDIEVSEVLAWEVRSLRAIPGLSSKCREPDVSDQATREVLQSPSIVAEPAAMDIDPVDDYSLEE
ncbi:hypothetical protein C8J57DRAFT_1252447 [Mycena rebaudengoi]|nr:hypothetical protein C8J57DRAFT_1252447 [Mycena rebaudengoi]